MYNDKMTAPDDPDSTELADLGFENSEALDDLTVKSADDPTLGLTGTPDHPAEDWAADTGPTRVP